MGERKLGLTVTITIAVLVLFGVSAGLLALDPRVTGADALRTGGLAAGSVVALYALWLNDRRRRIDEQRQEVEQLRQDLETRRTDLDRDRIADERFARAVELLGYEADQVRVGALHALAGLGRSHPDHTQTVLDVLCSYLRRPFLHPRYAADPTDESWSRRETHEAERKLQVRLTAQRLVADLLPAADDERAPAYDLDLTGATLEYFELTDRKVGALTLRYGRLFSSTNVSRSRFTGPVWLTGTTAGNGRMRGRFRCDDAVFEDRGWFSGFEVVGRTSFEGTRFQGPVKFAGGRFGAEFFAVRTSFGAWTDFRSAELTTADFTGATFGGEVLRADLRGPVNGELPPELAGTPAPGADRG
ncbi:pentapeptide repeat-containing protein [Saccharopolyspora montiporae]|uniref:pentapeptide repeat-containing protein n=1 Tax=Saccharopolyspora montiporae TaxID=2781240 RepID=UPI001D141D17|nr:pentapeptide repeat-containing protein [Saccharopolyspora sp. HNM0983]